MKKIYGILIVLLALLTTNNNVTWAQNKNTEEANSIVDLKTISCRKLLKLDDSDKEATIMFFQGYISGQKADVTANIPALSDVSDKVIDHCIDNPDDTLFDTFKKYRK